MATLKAHGRKIGELEFVTKKKAYMSDGNILQSRGEGWKLHGELKDGNTPEEAFKKAVEYRKSYLESHPAYAEYAREIKELFPLKVRWQVQEAIRLMPNDADGVWSTLDDYGMGDYASLDELCVLCDLFKSAEQESIEYKQAREELEEKRP